MYIETSAPRVNGDNAILLSPTFAGSTQTRCLNFWYHMYGKDVGTLNIHVSLNIYSILIYIIMTNLTKRGRDTGAFKQATMLFSSPGNLENFNNTANAQSHVTCISYLSVNQYYFTL